MGADIHIYAERRLKDGSWSFYRDYASQDRRMYENVPNPEAVTALWPKVADRDYGFFADLAGVRGPGPEPKGLPEDVSPLVAELSRAWGSDGHSHSWMLAGEFASIFLRHHVPHEEQAELVAERMESKSDTPMRDRVLRRYLGLDLLWWEEPSDGSDTYRFVFWFDN